LRKWICGDLEDKAVMQAVKRLGIGEVVNPQPPGHFEPIPDEEYPGVMLEGGCPWGCVCLPIDVDKDTVDKHSQILVDQEAKAHDAAAEALLANNQALALKVVELIPGAPLRKEGAQDALADALIQMVKGVK
jgi:hypothetical protein